jgi:hypothetical protein
VMCGMMRCACIRDGGGSLCPARAPIESAHMSIDPAPPSAKRSVEELKQRLMNTSFSMFKRYRAMFALRELGTAEAAQVCKPPSPPLCAFSSPWPETDLPLTHPSRLWQRPLSTAAPCCAMRSVTCWDRWPTKQLLPLSPRYLAFARYHKTVCLCTRVGVG